MLFALPEHFSWRSQGGKCSIFRPNNFTSLQSFHQKNVLISQDYRPKIIDFGNASSPPVDAVHSLSGGSTLRWMAPEAIEQQGLATAKGDVWAFGMTALVRFIIIILTFDSTMMFVGAVYEDRTLS